MRLHWSQSLDNMVEQQVASLILLGDLGQRAISRVRDKAH